MALPIWIHATVILTLAGLAYISEPSFKGKFQLEKDYIQRSWKTTLVYLKLAGSPKIAMTLEGVQHIFQQTHIKHSWYPIVSYQIPLNFQHIGTPWYPIIQLAVLYDPPLWRIPSDLRDLRSGASRFGGRHRHLRRSASAHRDALPAAGPEGCAKVVERWWWAIHFWRKFGEIPTICWLNGSE